VENAEKLSAELGPKAEILVNRKGGVVDSLALSGIERALEIPEVREPDRWSGDLGKRVLLHTYGKGTWGKYEPRKLFAGLRRRLSRNKED
jgi:hypothetical protein